MSLITCAESFADTKVSASKSAEIKSSANVDASKEDAEIFTAAYKYYLRTDYSSATELFKQIADKSSETGLEAALYLAAIYAYEGNPEASKYYERAINSSNLATRREAILEFGKFCEANKDWKRFLDCSLRYSNTDSVDSLGNWYLAMALWNTDDKEGAKKLFNETIQHYISDPSALGIDEFIAARLAKKPMALFMDISNLKPKTDAGKARMLILEGKNPTGFPQKNLSLFSQIKLAEAGIAIDLKVLEDSIFKYKGAPFAYEGALALGKIEFAKGNYDKAIIYANDALKLTPPYINYQWSSFMLLGDSNRMQKKYDEARENYLKIAMDKKARGEPIAESLYKTGICWYEQSDWLRAHAYFERVFVMFFVYEYWGSRAYYYDARALYTLGYVREANKTLIEYFRRAKDKRSKIYKMARDFYDQI